MKPLNSREKETVPVMIDLLLKGTTAHRIAKYCLEEKKFSYLQLLVFLDKLPISQQLSFEIVIAFKVLNGEEFISDPSLKEGEVLREWFNKTKI